MMETKYRIKETTEEGWDDGPTTWSEFQIQYRTWWWPFWLDLKHGECGTLEEAREGVEVLKAAARKRAEPKETYHAA